MVTRRVMGLCLRPVMFEWEPVWNMAAGAVFAFDLLKANLSCISKWQPSRWKPRQYLAKHALITNGIQGDIFVIIVCSVKSRLELDQTACHCQVTCKCFANGDLLRYISEDAIQRLHALCSLPVHTAATFSAMFVWSLIWPGLYTRALRS